MVIDSLVKGRRTRTAMAIALVGAVALTACDDEPPATFEVAIDADPVRGNAPLRVQFESQSRGPLDSVYTWAWAFGDGGTSADENPLHLFEAPGTYTVRLDMTDESVGGSGTAELVIDVAPPADLVVGDVAFAPRRLRTGTEMTVSWSVQNRGDTVLGAWDQVVVISADEIIDDTDTVIARRAGPEGLGTGASDAQELTFALPEGIASGDYRLAVVADPEERVGDANRADNTALAGPEMQVRNPNDTGPDLVVCGIAIEAFDMLPMGVTPTAQVSDQLGVEVCLGNNGDSPVPLARFAIYLSADDVLDADDLLVGVRGGVALAPGDRSFSDELVDLSVDPGDYYLFVVADPDDDVAEQIEDNNERIYGDPIRVVEPGEVEGVDLVITDLTLGGERVFWGQTLGGDLTLTNRGDTDVERFFVVRINVEPVDGGAPIQVGSINVPSLAAGAEETFDLRVSINRRIEEGDYRLVALADPTNGTDDVNEANNRRTYPGVLSLGGEPDVDATVSGVSLDPPVVDAGSTVNIIATIGNAGVDPTGALEGVIVLSADGVLGPEDIVVDEFDIDGLDGDSRTDIERAVIVPLELDQQIEAWRVAVVVDPDDRLTGERSEQNNVAFAPGDLIVEGAMGGCAEDDREPNNSTATAAIIEAGQYDGLGACDGVDWYAVAVPAGQVLDAAAAYDAVEGEVALRIADQAGQTLHEGEGLAGRSAAFLEPAENDRTVLIAVTPVRFSLQYDLSVALSDAGDGPNLRVRRVVPAPGVVPPGALLGVSFELVNVGGAAAPEGQAGILTGLEPDLSDGVIRGVVDTPAIVSGGATPVLGRVELPPDIADGRYVLAVRADEGDAIDEVDEDDNTAATGVRVDASGACPADAFEPNASPYVDGVVPIQAGLGAGRFEGLFACPQDDDWYAVELEPGQRLRVTATYVQAEGDVEMELFAPDGIELIDESRGIQGQEEVELLRAPAAGTWLVRVFLRGDTPSVSYALDVVIDEAEACADDASEPNGELAEAALLPDGVHDLRLCPGDEDWFRFAIPAGNTVSWQVSSGQAGVDIALFDQDGELIDEDDRRIAHLAQYNGFYYLRASVEGAADVVYQLRVSGVSGVDLSVDDVRLSRDAAEPQADLSARVLLSNRRGDAAADVRVQFLLSQDDEPSVDDTVLGEHVLDDVPGAASIEFEQRLSVPDDAPTGPLFVLAVADPEREIADVRPSNDVAVAPFEVLGACEDDDLRTNEGPVNATALELAAGAYDGVICPFTEDWFTFVVPVAGPVTVTLDAQDGADLDLVVFDGFNDLLLGDSRTEQNPESVQFELDGLTGLLIRVDGFDDARGSYTLSWEVP